MSSHFEGLSAAQHLQQVRSDHSSFEHAHGSNAPGAYAAAMHTARDTAALLAIGWAILMQTSLSFYPLLQILFY